MPKHSFLFAVVLFLASHQLSAEKVYVLFENGTIAGEVTTSPYEEYFEADAFSHAVTVPIDPSTGLPSGRHRHSPVMLAIRSNPTATPALVAAISTAQEFTTVRIVFVRTNQSSGAAEEYFTIELEQAVISEVKTRYSVFAEDYRPYGEWAHHEIAVVYRKITWTYVPDGTSVEDDWEQPVTSIPMAAYPGEEQIPTGIFDGVAVESVDVSLSALDGRLLAQSDRAIVHKKLGGLIDPLTADLPSGLYKYEVSGSGIPSRGGLWFRR